MINNVLYLMHIPWNWIKQRPHFIAEHLGTHFNLKVCARTAYRKSNLIGGSKSKQVSVSELFALPFNKLNSISKINSWLIGHQLRPHLQGCRIVWVTHPEMFDSIEKYLTQDTCLVYDCMDDALEFPHVKVTQGFRERLAGIEQRLIERCNILFVSSDYLKICLTERYEFDCNIIVINNAVNICTNPYNIQLPATIFSVFESCTLKRIVYVGTISAWLDMDLILASLEKFPGIAYLFVGPCEVELPKHKRIIHVGPIEYRFVASAMQYADILVMPFCVNKLIQSVNPIKVYEYIGSGKASIVVGYSETDKFGDYVYLYRSNDEYFNLLHDIIFDNLPPKKTMEECLRYIEGHTWQRRATVIARVINDYILR
jgi:hypothetical protein